MIIFVHIYVIKYTLVESSEKELAKTNQATVI